jgi:kanamycin kinase
MVVSVTRPRQPVQVPDIVTVAAAGRPVSAVWLNELGGVTWSIGGDFRKVFVKVYPDEHADLLVAEEQRLEWAGQFATVPRVLAAGRGWLQTEGLPGRSAVDPYWVVRPTVAAAAIGVGLRLLHDALPVDECPFGPPSWLPDEPRTANSVVCHGDACTPNTLVGDDGRCSGHVDLGDLGVADRWADLAIATMSLGWNYPGGDNLEAELLAAYGIRPDHDRIAYYRDRWNAPSGPSR